MTLLQCSLPVPDPWPWTLVPVLRMPASPSGCPGAQFPIPESSLFREFEIIWFEAFVFPGTHPQASEQLTSCSTCSVHGPGSCPRVPGRLPYRPPDPLFPDLHPFCPSLEAPLPPSCQGSISCPSASLCSCPSAPSPRRLDGTLSQAGLRGHSVSQKPVCPPLPRRHVEASSCRWASAFLACFPVFPFFPGTLWPAPLG